MNIYGSMKRKQDTLKFICAHPEGVTDADFKKAGIPPAGLGRLQQLKVIKGEQIREPERGTRCYHWLWKPVVVGGKK